MLEGEERSETRRQQTGGRRKRSRETEREGESRPGAPALAVPCHAAAASEIWARWACRIHWQRLLHHEFSGSGSVCFHDCFSLGVAPYPCLPLPPPVGRPAPPQATPANVAVSTGMRRAYWPKSHQPTQSRPAGTGASCQGHRHDLCLICCAPGSRYVDGVRARVKG